MFTQLLKLDNKQNFLHLIAEQLFFTMDEFELLYLISIFQMLCYLKMLKTSYL